MAKMEQIPAPSERGPIRTFEHRSLHDLPVNSTFTQLWLFLAIRFLSSTVFASPLHYLPGMVMDLR